MPQAPRRIPPLAQRASVKRLPRPPVATQQAKATPAVKPDKPMPKQINESKDSVGGWLIGLLDGSGTGPSQIIVTAILGCVPVVGQLFDLRDLILGIIKLAAAPTNVMAWVDLVITLIGCIPGFGDAFKAGVKLAKSGKSADRVFDAMRKYSKIDPKKALKEMDWNKLKQQCIQTLNSMLDEFIDVLDSWLTRQLVGAAKVREFVTALRQVKKDAPNMIGAAIDDLKATVNQMLGSHKPLVSTAETRMSRQSSGKITPKSNTGAGGASAKPKTPPKTKDKTGKEAPTVSSSKKPEASTGNKPTPAQVQKIRQAKKKRWSTGVPAEHIVDYYSKERRRVLRKINDHGRLVEEYDRLKRNAAGDRIRNQDINQTGIDHLWFGHYKGRKYTVGETKGSIFGHFAFLAGMAAGDAESIVANRGDIGKVLSGKGSDDINAPMREGRGTSGNVSMDNEGTLMGNKGKSGLSGTKLKGRQMSHKWIYASLDRDNSVSNSHKETVLEAIDIARFNSRNPSIYNREIYMVTGKQYEFHDRSKGRTHKIQTPMISIPDNVLVE